jgi:hypothetical protein
MYIKHLIFVIHEKHLEYRMDDQYQTHPLFNEQPQKVIDYLIKIIQPNTHEIIAP